MCSDVSPDAHAAGVDQKKDIKPLIFNRSPATFTGWRLTTSDLLAQFTQSMATIPALVFFVEGFYCADRRG
jgi:hypothetical protein